jgi:transcriptional regulator with XRE-family HTH domain
MDRTVGDNVRAEMARQHLKQSWLADQLGCSQQTLSRRLCGYVSFDIPEVARIAELLGVSLSDLFTQQNKEISA